MLTSKQLNKAIELTGRANPDQLRSIFLAGADVLAPPKPIPVENTRGYTCPDCGKWRLFTEGCPCLQLTQ